MEFSRSKPLMLAGAALLVTQSVALAADYPMRQSITPQYYPPPPPPQQQYYPPQPIYQQPQPIYQQQPVYHPQPVYQPPPVYVPPPPPVIAQPMPVVYQGSYQGGGGFSDCCNGWYLRGDIGMSNQNVDRLYNVLYEGANVTNVSKGFDSGLTFGVGVGYQINNWLRADLTGEYRGKTAFRGLDTYGGGAGVDDYYGSKSEWLYLANFYVDLGTWWCLTPFVGAGVGFSKVTISDFRDNNIPTHGVAFGKDASKWNPAWALHAGVSYEVSPNVALELSYRYVNLGDGMSGDLQTYDGQNSINNPMEFKGITSQDVRLGLRWKFGCCDIAPLPPQPVYQPPPPPPPLMRRG